ncbi:hypothetical protein [Bacteroides sp. 51]|uniref:hypothetical protein n=1 Tax=Bacteroides sp. 51 TaxID=2302938 RepID=UPI0013D5572B|nr:hypothetical protein [Bacteroides sp. 51]NDV84528.1 hypothetical protein [Bacteroides sp. 51]
MKKHRQEDISGWLEDAKALARAEKELGIEKWVILSIEYQSKDYRRVVLYQYDLPRDLYEKYRWVVRWRQARCQCLHPRETVQLYHSYYDKRTGLKTDFNSCLSKLAASKAQITIAKKREQEYLIWQRQNNLFFDENIDEELIKYREKLKKKEDNYNLLYQNIQHAVEEHLSIKQ